MPGGYDCAPSYAPSGHAASSPQMIPVAKAILTTARSAGSSIDVSPENRDKHSTGTTRKNQQAGLVSGICFRCSAGYLDALL